MQALKHVMHCDLMLMQVDRATETTPTDMPSYSRLPTEEGGSSPSESSTRRFIPWLAFALGALLAVRCSQHNHHDASDCYHKCYTYIFAGGDGGVQTPP